MIPKKIHYIWLGDGGKNKLTEVCINSWKRFLPDYEIKLWNENNIDLTKLCKNNLFLATCYKLKLWAFVSDYLRLWILEQEGGIYFDTDVEVVKSFDDLLSNKIFMGYEEGGYVGTAIIGAEPHNSLIKRLLKFYDDEIWNVDFINNPIIFRYLLKNEPYIFYECHIYQQDYFSPYIFNKEYKGVVESKETYSIHWYTQNWNMSLSGYIFIHTKHIKNPIIKLLVKLKKTCGYIRKRFIN